MADSTRLVDPVTRRDAAMATALVAAAMLAGGCTGPLPSDEQRAAMVDATRMVVEGTAEGLGTESIDVTDDGTEPRACADGGSQYVYAAKIGPIASGDLSSTLAGALTSAETGFLGVMQKFRLQITSGVLAELDEASIIDAPHPDGDRRVTYAVSTGELEGITLTYLGSPTDGDQVVTTIRGYTRCSED
ncbi:hypothetical protein J1G42_02900 [Cellulomonas sp. zg-ZUI222]|uniref:Lipoprotein n=1 Tax=Cellulomonas wangleii TaxID=2816956 RepID=A0ABX8D3R9_9CELL|nr:hypothetical protein [Cellulomonas wangleii]MBO0919773.1 hypothetical protein [Cellulomonas wangleii]MBO0923802.1 hypothetical protein [Cellulomonas wangleii]MBO0924084.1 hypothetical protein [Cellulomonas wangleii]QVI62109.1 hypothetical protein KG103_17115 [Cellulomonas wangleii]